MGRVCMYFRSCAGGIFLIACLCLNLATAAAGAGGAAPNGLVDQVASYPAILSRRKLDQRLQLHEAKVGDKSCVHVWFPLSRADTPWGLSLGWFTYTDLQGGKVLVDEFGQPLADPDIKPKDKEFPKGDYLAIKGFDLASQDRLKAAGSLFKSAVKAAPQSARLRNNWGACLANSGNLDEADAQLDRAVVLKPDYALAWANRALLKLEQGDIDQAIQDANKALSLQGDLMPALLAYGAARVRSGDQKEAMVVSQRLAALFPADWRAAAFAGDIAVAAGQLKEARQYFLKSLVLRTGNAAVLTKLAYVFERLGNLDEAIKKARLATIADPESFEAHQLLGRYLEMDRDFKAARLQYERALEVKPPDREKESIYGPLLRVLLKADLQENADKLSKRWLKENPKSATCHYNRAWVLTQLGDPEASHQEAVDEYRLALDLDPQLCQAHYNLALLLIGQGRSHQAEEALEIFLEKRPEDPDAEKARELLAKLKEFRRKKTL